MPGPVHTLASTAIDVLSIPAVAKVTPNLRASTATGTLSTIGDTVIFPGVVPPFTITGNWTVPNTRVFAARLPTISQTAVGVCVNIVGVPTSPMTIVAADPRVVAQ